MLLAISWRSLWRNKRRTAVTASSIALSLALTVFFVALGDGMYGNLVQGVVRMEAGNLTVEQPAYHDAPGADVVVDGIPGLRARIERVPGVVGTKALVIADGIARSSAGGAAVGIMGIEPAAEAKLSPSPASWSLAATSAAAGTGARWSSAPRWRPGSS